MNLDVPADHLRNRDVMFVPVNLEKVVVGFFVLMAATLNFGYVIGDISDPGLHNVYEL